MTKPPRLYKVLLIKHCENWSIYRIIYLTINTILRNMSCLFLKLRINTLFIICILFVQMASYCFANEPIYPIPKPDNINVEKFELGQTLFKEVKLSGNQQTSCYSCHNVAAGGSDGLKTSKNLPFNSSTILNVSKNYYIGWKGKFTQLKPHLEMLFANPNVMGTNWPLTLSELKANSLYLQWFNSLYDDGISKENIIDAVLYYETNLIVPSKFDKFLLGDESAISFSAKQGYNKFKDYGCASCHQGANVGGNVFQKLGVVAPYKGINGQYKTEKLRVPSLRNVAQTAPYFHDGSVHSLRRVVSIMAKHQLGQTLEIEDVEQIIAFLTSLNSITE